MNHKRILVPVNLEKNSFDGLLFICGLAGIVPVYATLLYVVNLNVAALDRRLFDEVRSENERRLRSLAKRFSCDPLPYVNVRIGKPHEEILSEAKSIQAELIVLGSPKSQQRARLFPGATTVERVVRRAPCLTLVLPSVWTMTSEQYRQAMRTEVVAA